MYCRRIDALAFITLKKPIANFHSKTKETLQEFFYGQGKRGRRIIGQVKLGNFAYGSLVCPQLQAA